MNTKELEHIFEELLSVYQNLKAEIVVAELQKNSSLTQDNLVVKNKSAFRRSHRRDILNLGSIEDNTLFLNLSRNGLYDQLPEGLFHTKDKTNSKTSYPELRKTYKKEEEEARHFFLPLENEFFNQKLNIEKKEQELLNNFINLDDNFLIDFWKIDQSIPKKYLLKLLKLLPYAYKIAGNIELMELCLKNILNKKVKINKTYNPNPISNRNLVTDEVVLGTNFTLTKKNNTILQPYYQVEIGPIEEEEIIDFISKDGILKFVNVFYDYFFPIEVSVKTKLKVINNDGFLLNQDKQPIMGLSTTL
ncbi:hypothetical protein [Lacinutrix salivirga]